MASLARCIHLPPAGSIGRGRALAGLVLCLASLSPACASATRPEPVEITLYAAASLRDVLEALTPACERASGTRLVVNLGASSDLARQIEAGNKADLFFSADEAQMDRLERTGLVESASRRSVLSNRLVVVGRTDDALTVGAPAELLDPSIRWVALANPDSVPAGKYARAWLERTDVWQSLVSRVLPCVDVRAALAAVEAGGARVGIVYRTDARISTKVRVLHEVPESESPRITYVIAALRRRSHGEAAGRVVDFLSGPVAFATYEKFGFVVATPGHAGHRPDKVVD